MEQHLDTSELQSLRAYLEKIALEAGDMIRSAMISELVIETNKNAANDLVTQVDREVEDFISQRLAAKYPGYAFIGEETFKAGTSVITDGPTFIVDPIDGTSNFVHGHPEVCVSIGFTTQRVPTIGVVYNPFRSEIWSAAKGHGAFLQVHGSRHELPLHRPAPPLKGLNTACIGLELGSDRSGPNFDLNTHVFRTLASSDIGKGGRSVHALRFHGSAAQTICRVAAGQQDAFWQCGCWAWDVAAAWCVLTEAGGIIVDGHPNEWNPPVDNRRYLAVRAAPVEEQEAFVRDFWTVLGDKRSTYSADTGSQLQHKRYPGGVPIKFSPQGEVAVYKGNTTVCHIPSDSPVLPKLQNIYTALQTRSTLSPLVYLVPPESWHMTIFSGVRDKIRSPGTWPPGAENMPLEDCTQNFSRKLRDFGLKLPQLGLGPPYLVCLYGFDTVNDTSITVKVRGATASEENRLRRLRDCLADLLFEF